MIAAGDILLYREYPSSDMTPQRTDSAHLKDIQLQSSTEQRRNDTNASGIPIGGSDLPIALLSPVTTGDPIIAVDLDDVLSQTNAAIANCKDIALLAIDDLLISATGHNDSYGSPGEISFSNFYYYYYWKVSISCRRQRGSH